MTRGRLQLDKFIISSRESIIVSYLVDWDMVDKIQFSDKDLEFYYYDEIGQIKGTVKVDVTQCDYLDDLGDQWVEEVELGKDYEIMNELDSDIEFVWENDLHVKFYYNSLYFMERIPCVAIFDVYTDEFEFRLEGTRSKYYSGDLLDLLLDWKKSIND